MTMLFRDYLSVSFKDIARQPIRSTLTVLALAISAAIMFSLVSISRDAKSAIIEGLGLDRSLTTVVVTANSSSQSSILGGGVQYVNEDAEMLNPNAVEELGIVEGVTSVYPTASVWELKSFRASGSDKTFSARVTAIGGTDLSEIEIDSGSIFDPYETSPAVVIGHAYAKELGYLGSESDLVGKEITFTSQQGFRGIGADIPRLDASKNARELFDESTTELKGRIVGVTTDGIHKNELLVPIGWANLVKTPMYWTGDGLRGENQIEKYGYSAIYLQTEGTSQVHDVSRRVSSMGYGAYSSLEQLKQLDQYLLVMWLVLGAVATISLIAACLGIANTMYMTISEERYSIGVWRACGARKRVIANLFLVQAMLLGALGGLTGVIIGIAISAYVNSSVIELMQNQGITISNTNDLSILLILLTVAMSTALSAFSGLFPALKAAGQDPSRSLSSI